MDGIHELLNFIASVDIDAYLKDKYSRSDDLVIMNILR